jgi:hypothetical protein
VLISVSASDNVGVSGVRFLLDEHPFGAEVTAAPYKQAWMTSTVPNGSHVLTALAHDAAGNESSSTVTLTVSNDTAAPTVALTSPPAGATLRGTVTVMATASDDLEVFGVRFTVDGVPLGAEVTVPPYIVWWTTTGAANGPHAVAAIARDAAGHEATASVVVTVANDTAPPTVTLTSPAEGATLGGVTTLVAAASDDVGVVGVQFKIDGALVGVDSVAPYELLWNTLDAANGTHLVTVVALDGASNETATSAEVAVLNDSSTPTAAN